MADESADPRIPRFYKIFHAVLANNQLSAVDALVDAYLFDWYAWKGIARPGLRRISGDLGISSGRAAMAVSNLIKCGLWTVTRPTVPGSRETSRYTPADDHPAVVERSNSERSIGERSSDGRSAQPVSAERSAGERNQTELTRLKSQTEKSGLPQRSPRIGTLEMPRATHEAIAEAVTGLPASNGRGQPERKVGNGSRARDVTVRRKSGGTATYHDRPVLRQDLEDALAALTGDAGVTDRERHECLSLIRRAGGTGKGEDRVLAIMQASDSWGEAVAHVKTKAGSIGFEKGKRKAAPNPPEQVAIHVPAHYKPEAAK